MGVVISSFPTVVGEQNQAFRFSFVFFKLWFRCVPAHTRKKKKKKRRQAGGSSAVAGSRNRP